MTRTTVILLIVLACALPVGWAHAQSPRVSLSFIPLWSPQAQFAGYYVAQKKGIYQRHGMDVTILEGGPGQSASEYLKTGKADIALLWLSTAIQLKVHGVPLVHLSQVIPRSSMMLVAKRNSGIQKPSDMNGKKVGLWGGDFAIPPRAFFLRYHLHVREIPQSYTVNLFLRGGVDVASAMWYNEYHTIINSGIDPDELEVFPLDRYGVNLPEDGIYVLESAYKKNPKLMHAFAEASFEGWQYAFEHMHEALDIVLAAMQEAGISANRIHQQWMLERMRDLILSDGSRTSSHKIGLSDFKEASGLLKNLGLIGNIPDYQQFIGENEGGE